MSGLIIGIISSLIAAPLVAFLTIIYRRGKAGVPNWRESNHLYKRLEASGVQQIFLRRADYVEHSSGGSTIESYVDTANSSLIYVGYWLAHGTEIASILKTFNTMLDRGVTIELALLSRALPKAISSELATMLNMPEPEMRQRISNAWIKMLDFQAALGATQAARFVLKSHQHPLGASIFIFDKDNATKEKIQVDFKIFGLGRSNTFSIEMVPGSAENSLYSRFKTAYCNIAAEAQII